MTIGLEDPIVPQPTYLADVRWFFDPVDIEHMAAKGLDLGTYPGVKKNALAIYAHVGPDGDMPPEPARKWSASKKKTFLNWILAGYPQGVAVPAPGQDEGGPPARVRKNVNDLSAPEVETLKQAFLGVMSRDPSAGDSYFAIASKHGLPETWCSHHIDQYNPWHRVYLMTFENALRSVPGCEGVTLPYWDISTPLPGLLSEAPFATYELPLDPGITATPPQPGKYFPYSTQRYTVADIQGWLTAYRVLEDIETSKTQSTWGAYNIGGYQKFSIQAHDGGHVSIGPTMATQEVAAFDPVFWFFHCNLDRLWLRWQQQVGATTLSDFKSTITEGDTTWLEGPPPLNSLPPFTTSAGESISLSVGYEGDAVAAQPTFENSFGGLEATRAFKIRAAMASVRVKGIDRLSIPGSFIVHLLADGEPIDRRAFFQPDSPRKCAACAKQALVNLDFRITQASLQGRRLSVAIEVPSQREIGLRFPLSAAGSPTINIRLLLDEQQ